MHMELRDLQSSGFGPHCLEKCSKLQITYLSSLLLRLLYTRSMFTTSAISVTMIAAGTIPMIMTITTAYIATMSTLQLC